MVDEVPGQSLDDYTRTAVLPAFSYDFSQVRIHTGSRAAQSARTIGTSACTVGNHIASQLPTRYALHRALGQGVLKVAVEIVVTRGPAVGTGTGLQRP